MLIGKMLIGTKMTNEEKKAYLSDALVAHNGLAYLVDKAAEVLNNPILILDPSMKVLAKSTVLEAETEFWESLDPNNEKRIIFAKEVEKAGVFEHLMHKDTPIYGSFYFSEHRMLGCRIRDKIGSVAYSCIIEMNPIQPEDEELLVYLCKLFYFEMLYTGQTAMQRIPEYSIISDLIEGSADKQEITQRIEYLGVSLPKKIRLLVLQYDKNQLGLSIFYINSFLSSQLQDCISLVYDDRIVIIMDEEKWGQQSLNIIMNQINDYKIRIGTGFCISDVMDIKSAYDQALTAIAIGSESESQEKYYSYESYALKDLIMKLEKSTDLSSFIHPRVRALREYDMAHGTELEMTFETYLSCLQSIVRTAEELHIHRSTLYSRLEKIDEILTSYGDSEDDLFLRLSLYIDKYVGMKNQ